MLQKEDILFEVQTPIGVQVRSTHEYWKIITTQKHPVMADKLEDVKIVLHYLMRSEKVNRTLRCIFFIKKCVQSVGLVQSLSG
mgnify:CR=1 FL=1